MVSRSLAPARAMRSRTCAHVIQPCRQPVQTPFSRLLAFPGGEIKIQPKTKDLSTRLREITTEFAGFIPLSFVLKSLHTTGALTGKNGSPASGMAS